MEDFGKAWSDFKEALLKELKIKELVEWLNKHFIKIKQYKHNHK